MHVETRESELDVGVGILTLTSRTTRKREATRRGDVDLVDSLSAIRFDPSDSDRHSAFVAYIGHTFHEATTVFCHTIVAFRAVDFDSEVLNAVITDNVEDLQRLLVNQQATVRDCDMYNRSLLNVSHLLCISTPQLLGWTNDVLSTHVRTTVSAFASFS